MKLFSVDSFRYDRDRIFQRLKILPEKENVYEYACEIFPRLEAIARQEVELLCGYATFSPPPSLGVPELDGCERLTVCLTSCSDRIAHSIARLLEEGDLLEGYILNDLANDILFTASEDMNCQLYEEMKAQGYHLTPRFTPGENSLPLAHQCTFLTLLKERRSDLPITLTERFMLRPEKAMLYAYGGDRALPDRPIAHDCSKCSNTACFYRRKP